MAGHGKVISLFLMDGDPALRWECELSNWTGLGFKIPRRMLSESKNLDRINSPGIYFLIGKSDDESQPSVYVGEAENIHYRLTQHDVNKEEWNECVVFCSKDSTLNKAKIKYLENSLYNLSKKSGRCTLINSNEPTKSQLSHREIAEVEEYLDNLKVMLGAMGFSFLKPFHSIADTDEKETVFYCTWFKGVEGASAILVDEGILVRKGSKVRPNEVPSLSVGKKKLRAKLREDGIIVDNVFQVDYLFSSYSSASDVVCGSAKNGWVSWITEDGVTIDQYLNSLMNQKI